MTKNTQRANQTEDIQENVHKNRKWIAKARINAKNKLTPKMFKLYCEYSDHLLLCSHSISGRKKMLTQFVIIVNRFKIKDLTTITAEEIKQIVISIMVENSDNGKESWYSQDLKKQVRFLVRFAKTGSHYLADEGELPELRQIKCRTIADKLSREELPTEEDCKEILNACDSPMDRAMLHVQMEAGTRVGELLTLQIKHVVTDAYGAMIAVDGKTGARQIRIVSSVPDLLKWINVHPYKDDREHALFITTINNKYRGRGLSYVAFKRRLATIVAKTNITKRIHSHLFRHAEITKRAGDLTEAQARIRYGWGKSSNMPSRYTHLNDKDVDNKMLQLMGVTRKEEVQEASIIECQYCHVKYSIDTKYCETCAKPLDAVEAERMEREQKDKTQAMIYELVRKERAEKAKQVYHEKRDNQMEELLKQNQELQDMVNKMSKAQ